MEKLDETDIQILKTLQKNAKLTTKELADAVHLTPTPVFERQKRLEKNGYIIKYVAVLDPEKLDQGLLVFCKVKLKQINHEIADAFVRRIMRIQEVTECYNTSGAYDRTMRPSPRPRTPYNKGYQARTPRCIRARAHRISSVRQGRYISAPWVRHYSSRSFP